jgi:hypothetical protein
MQELVSPTQSELLVTASAVLLAVIGAFIGWRVAGQKGMVWALLGPLLWLMWQGHKFITRYDPTSGYFGLDKVAVLAIEVVVFIVLGLVLGAAWGKIRYQRDTVDVRTDTE